MHNTSKWDKKSGCAFLHTRGQLLKKSLTEFAALAAKKVKIIFSGGVYLGENTVQPESVAFVR